MVKLLQAGELNRFDRWLSRTEEEIDEAVKVKPTTRLEACQLLATFKVTHLAYC